MPLNKVYAVCGRDPETWGILKTFSKKEDAEAFLKSVIEYEKTKPYTYEEMAKEAASEDDILFENMCNEMETWRNGAPSYLVDFYISFLIQEIEVL